MTDPPTIILSQRFSTDSNEVWKAAVGQGWSVHRAIRYSVPDPLPELRCVYGEMTTCDIVAERARLALLEPDDEWLAKLPDDLIKRHVECVKLVQVGCLTRFQRRLFFKPANDKVFEKGVFEMGSEVPYRGIDLNVKCLVSEVVSFDREVRLWCLDGKILAHDFYRIIGEHDEETVKREAVEFGQRVLNEHANELPSSVVVDVGFIEGRGWAVVEANQAYASGIYGDTDPKAVLECCLRAAGPRELVRKSDEGFIRT